MDVAVVWAGGAFTPIAPARAVRDHPLMVELRAVVELVAKDGRIPFWLGISMKKSSRFDVKTTFQFYRPARAKINVFVFTDCNDIMQIASSDNVGVRAIRLVAC